VVEWLEEHQSSLVHATREAPEQQVFSSEETKEWTIYAPKFFGIALNQTIRKILPIVDKG